MMRVNTAGHVGTLEINVRWPAPGRALLAVAMLLTVLAPGAVDATSARSRPAVAPASLAASCNVVGDVGGTVFRDFNENGVQDVNEPGVGGVSITVAPDVGIPIPTVSDPDGTWAVTVTAGTAVRIEFTVPASEQSGAFGTDSGTSVQFTASPNCQADFGINIPSLYCQADPFLVTPKYNNGNPLGGGSSGTGNAIVSFANSYSGSLPVPTNLATNAQTGATWGVAYQRTSKTLFAAALLKRHVGFGTLGTGGIYKIDVTNIGSPVVTPFVDLTTLGVATGADPHTGLPASATTENHDPNAFDAVGKIAVGDMDISGDEKTLWLVNLNDKTLYQVFVDLPAVVPTALDVTGHPILDPGCSNAEYAPFAVGVNPYDEQVYVGIVCTAETSQVTADLHAYIVKHDPAGANGNFSPVYDFPLTYPRGKISISGINQPDAEWRPWIDQWTDINTPAPGGGPFGQTMYPQPMFSDIEFDTDSSLILGFMDRAGHQLGNANYSTIALDTQTYEGVGAGDILRLCNNAGTLVLENNAACPGGPATGGANFNQGPGIEPNAGEYYWQDMYPLTGSAGGGTHQEIGVGGLTLIPGRNEVASTAFDAASDFRAGGIIYLNNANGTRTRSYQVFGQDDGGRPATFGKAVGLGDLEPFCDPAPIEIGNRIWFDADQDGIQDPGEDPIAGVTVELFKNNVLVGTAVTDALGQFYFVGGTAIDPDTGDNIGIVNGGILPLMAYEIRVDMAQPALTGLSLSPANAGPNTIDSDASQTGTTATIAFSTGTAGQNDHTLDIGFFEDTPTGARLISLTASGGPTRVTLRWQTASETDLAGFHVYRSTKADGEFIRANADLVPATGTAAGGAAYVFTDRPGAGRFYYRIEMVNNDGSNEAFDRIVSATVGSPATRPVYLPRILR